jgi:hypothetical protein
MTSTESSLHWSKNDEISDDPGMEIEVIFTRPCQMRIDPREKSKVKSNPEERKPLFGLMTEMYRAERKQVNTGLTSRVNVFRSTIWVDRPPPFPPPEGFRLLLEEDLFLRLLLGDMDVG